MAKTKAKTEAKAKATKAPAKPKAARREFTKAQRELARQFVTMATYGGGGK